jgi:hypothetical protein
MNVNSEKVLQELIKVSSCRYTQFLKDCSEQTGLSISDVRTSVKYLETLNKICFEMDDQGLTISVGIKPTMRTYGLGMTAVDRAVERAVRNNEIAQGSVHTHDIGQGNISDIRWFSGNGNIRSNWNLAENSSISTGIRDPNDSVIINENQMTVHSVGPIPTNNEYRLISNDPSDIVLTIGNISIPIKSLEINKKEDILTEHSGMRALAFEVGNVTTEITAEFELNPEQSDLLAQTMRVSDRTQQIHGTIDIPSIPLSIILDRGYVTTYSYNQSGVCRTTFIIPGNVL